ncbi:MAG: hypothetical protein HY748_17900 [Elusimicrobia bacterium]|nr:hypothetical protein [Elusimicrobiota bacterium]
MKKLLGSVLAIAMLVQPGFASAELLKNFKLSGQVDLQSQASRNVYDFVTRQDELSNIINPNTGAAQSGQDITRNATERPTFNDRTNNAQFRVIVNLDWDLLDDVHTKVTLRKNDRAWGTAGGMAEDNAPYPANARQYVGGAGAGSDAAGQNLLGELAIDQAYVKVDKVFGHIDFTAGRQFYGEPGDLVIYYGPQDNLYGLPTNGLDALRIDVGGLPYVNITGLAGKAVGSGIYTTNVPAWAFTGADTDVRGLVFSLKEVENINLDAFAYNRVQHFTGALGNAGGNACVDNDADGVAGNDPGECTWANNWGKNDTLYVYGLKGKVNFGGFTGKMLFAKNAGKNRYNAPLNWDVQQDGVLAAGNDFSYNIPGGSYSGWAWTVDGEFKADIEDIASFTPWIHFGIGTGRNSMQDAQNEGFQSVNSDYRPGTIYGRFGSQLGSMIPCVLGAVGCTVADIDGDGNDPLAGAGSGEGLGVRTAGTHMGASNIGGVGLNNRVIWGAGLKVTPAFANKLTVGITVWDFRFQKITDDKVIWVEPDFWAANYGNKFPTGAGVGANLGSFTYCNATSCYSRLPNVGTIGAGGTGDYWDGSNGAQGFSNGRTQKHIGNELDVDLTWKHSDNVSFQAGIASFRPGKYIQELIRDNYNAGGIAAGGSPGMHGAGMRVSNNPVVLAYGDMHIKF